MKIILSTLIIAGFYSFLYPAATIATRQRTQSVSHRPTLTATVVTRQRSHSAPTTQSELERVRKWQATQTMQRSINSRSLDPSRSVVNEGLLGMLRRVTACKAVQLDGIVHGNLVALTDRIQKGLVVRPLHQRKLL